MKLKSFLFLTAALAVGLALAGCSTDSDDGGTTTITDYRGYAGDADAIMAAFKFADEVWLTRETDLTGQILAIPSGKTLHVDGWQVNVDDGTILAVDGTLDLNATGSIINSEKAGAVLVNVTGQLNTQEAQEAHYGSASTPYTAGTEGLVFVKNDGTPKDTETKRYIAGPASAVLGGGTYAASNADGTTSIVLGNTGTANGEYDNTGGGTLLITGDLNFGTGFVNNGGYLAVYGELKGGTLDSASQVLKNESGVTVANTVEITGGSISNALKILTSAKPFGGTSPAGTLVILGGVLSAPEGFLVTFDGPAKFITAPTINKAKFNGDVEFDVASITIADAEFAANVEVTATAEQTTATTAKFTGASPTLTGNLSAPTITFNSSGNLTVTGGSLSTESTLALGTSLGSIVLGKAGGIEFTGEGKLTGTGYEVSNAGSLLNTATEVGTMVTLGASGITTDFTGQDDYTPTIVFGGEKLLLNFKDNATINGFNLDIKTGGSISIGTPEAPLANKAIKITGGGSITAQAVAGTIGGGELYIVTNAAGSLVTGAKASLLDAGGSLGAGSYGTATATTNFIYSKVETAQSFFVTSGTDAAFGTLSSYTGPDESTDVGSIALFTSSTLGN